MESLIVKKKKSVVGSLFQSLDQRAIMVLKILLASCLIGISAQIKIPLYFTPVPLTIQTSAVMLIGALLGSRHGAIAALCYLIQGCIGLPVWAGGASGFAHFMGPTGGYLMAYIVQAYIIGRFLERQARPTLPKVTMILLFSICVQMGVGSLWLAQYVGFGNCFMLGFYPFVLGEAIKALLIAIYLKYRNFRETRV
jgi:biotin transport system substrate-specific component